MAQNAPGLRGPESQAGNASLVMQFRKVHLLSAGVGLLMAVQSGTGMLFFGLYRDQQPALDAWRVNDPVTFFVAVPLLFASLTWASRGSLRGLLVLLGVIQYALYNYAFYLFGAALNVYFLLYVALFIVSSLTLIVGLTELDMSAVRESFASRTPVRSVSSYMALWAITLGGAWIGQSLRFALTGHVPGLGEGSFRLIAALDLSLVVAPVAIGAALLWARRAWGYVLAILLNTKGAIYAALLSIASCRGGPVAQGGGDGLLALWMVLALGSFCSLLGLLASMRSAR